MTNDEMNEELGSFVNLCYADGSYSEVVLDDEPRIDAAFGRWIDSHKNDDTFLELSLISGGVLKLPASLIDFWIITTPLNRKRAAQLEAMGTSVTDAYREEFSVRKKEWEDD